MFVCLYIYIYIIYIYIYIHIIIWLIGECCKLLQRVSSIYCWKIREKNCCLFYGRRVCILFSRLGFLKCLLYYVAYDGILLLLRLARSVQCGSKGQAIYIALLVMSYTAEYIFHVFLLRWFCERAKKIPQVGAYLPQSPSEVEGLVIKEGSA